MRYMLSGIFGALNVKPINVIFPQLDIDLNVYNTEEKITEYLKKQPITNLNANDVKFHSMFQDPAFGDNDRHLLYAGSSWSMVDKSNPTLKLYLDTLRTTVNQHTTQGETRRYSFGYSYGGKRYRVYPVFQFHDTARKKANWTIRTAIGASTNLFKADIAAVEYKFDYYNQWWWSDIRMSMVLLVDETDNTFNLAVDLRFIFQTANGSFSHHNLPTVYVKTLPPSEFHWQVVNEHARTEIGLECYLVLYGDRTVNIRHDPRESPILAVESGNNPITRQNTEYSIRVAGSSLPLHESIVFSRPVEDQPVFAFAIKLNLPPKKVAFEHQKQPNSNNEVFMTEDIDGKAILLVHQRDLNEIIIQLMPGA